MTTPLEVLLKVLPPPAQPAHNRGDWTAVERDLGVPVPGDFKQFIETYGSGWVSGMIGIINPFDISDGMTWSKLCRIANSIYRSTDCAYPPYPRDGCLLPLGSTDNGDYINWVVQGPADDWKVVYWHVPGEEEDITRTQFGFTEFLADLLANKPPLFWTIFDPEFFAGLRYGPKS